MRILIVGVACGLLALFPSIASADPPAGFFDIQAGNVPIIITAPHGGTMQPTDIELVRPVDHPDDVILNDFKTNLLADKLADDFFALTGLNPYVVINKIDRKYLDLNRDKTDNGNTAAFDDTDAEPYYDYYHTTVQGYVDDVINTWGEGLFLDIHGQSQQLDVVFRGTRNGDTVESMINNYGELALIGPNSIFGQLAADGYQVDPANVPLNVDPEVTFIGGYTVDTYGSHQPGGIDAIQIEFGRDYRDTNLDPNIWQTTGADMADASNAYYQTFLVPEPSSLTLAVFGVLALAGAVWRRRRVA